MLGPILVSIHNLTYYQRLMELSRQAIQEDRYASFMAEKVAGWSQPVEPA
jgi:queuine tRNA-ribosyltransferase